MTMPPLCFFALCRLEMCPHRGLSTCYPVVTNLFSGRTDIFLFLFPLWCLLVSSCIPIVRLQNREPKRTNVLFFCLSVWSLVLETSKQKSKESDIFGSSCFMNVEIKPWGKTDSFQAYLKQLQK